MLTALIFRTRSQAYCAIVTIEFRIKTSPAFLLFSVFAYSHRFFKTFNRAQLKYSLGALCRFPGGGYTRAALETVYNQLIRQVFKTIAVLIVWSSFTGGLH